MRGIKTKIGLNVAVLILLSALVTDILVIVVVQRVMLRSEVSRNTRFIQNIGQLYFSGKSISPVPLTEIQDLTASMIGLQDRIRTIYVIDSDERVLYPQDSESYPLSLFGKDVGDALAKRTSVVRKMGYTWSLFWWQPSALSISVPVQNEKQIHGVVAAMVPLDPVYQTLATYHKPIFYYIIINTAVLTILGLYRIFRQYLRPIDRIIHQADEFHDVDDIFFTFRQEDNELNRLSSALNRMFTRISTDQKKLQTTVASLERANIELQNAQKEIIRAEKLASMGQLAAGIAHEIGNPIGIVLGYLDMLKDPGLDEEDKVDFLKRTEDEVQRINDIIRKLLDLARPKDTRNTSVRVSEVINDIVDVMKLQPVMTDTDIVLQLEAFNDSVWGNDDQLRQVFLNLLLNAADAIQAGPTPQDGRIEVNTSNRDGVDGGGNPVLLIDFTDNGGGIDSEKLKNIFDPFYTTKEPGKGTGLGLAVSYMIIQSMGGTIHAESRTGQGARFRIEMPVVKPAEK